MSEPIDAERLRKLAESATPGPWTMAGTPERPWPCVSSWHERRGYLLHTMANVRETDPDVWPHMFETYCRDAAYIAAANPATVLQLLGELDRLRSENAMLREIIQDTPMVAHMRAAVFSVLEGEEPTQKQRETSEWLERRRNALDGPPQEPQE